MEVFRSVTTQLRIAIGSWLLVVASAAHGVDYTSLFVFGDSLSDVGNISSWTAGIFPGSTYYEGRFSNGPVYSERLSQQLGLGTLTTSTAGGNNFAYGGAMTSGTTGLYGSVIDDLDEQVDDYVTNRSADPNGLYVVWAGANDLFDGQTNMSIPVSNIASDIGRLYDHGARQFLVMNLPKLGVTPSYNGTAASAADWNARTAAFNTELSVSIDGLRTSLPEVSLLEFDVESLFDQLLGDPAAYGLVNITDSAAPGLYPGRLFYSSNNVVDSPNTYLFWDNVHPTATVHAELAEAVFDFLTPDVLQGDFNGDGLVTLADYTMWRDHLGASDESLINSAGDGLGGVDMADYELWKLHFGGAMQALSSSPSTRVPEPASLALVIAVAISIWPRRV